jgi:hypothetical protein
MTHPTSRELFAALGEALHGADDPRVKELRTEDPGPWLMSCPAGCGQIYMTSTRDGVMLPHGIGPGGWGCCPGSEQPGRPYQSLAPTITDAKIESPVVLQEKGNVTNHEQ